MSPERWQQVEEIFERAIDLAPADRLCFLREACGADEDLRAEVAALVGADEAASDFIETPAIARRALSLAGEWSPQTETNSEIDDGFAGRCIGAYRLTSELGRGGMGVVYLAERADSEFRKRVAIKLIKRGMDTDFILRRFRHERQILANLEHTNIARLIDGGTTDDGLPFFVMEYIEGAPLYEFCDQHQLTVAERLKIFCQICGAVSYAHQHKIVHRDIKPSNVLVTCERAPKLLDFGIAKLLDADTSGQTNDPTQTALRLMTPEYAAPEQVQGQRISPATDVYALGVLLYELLTGHRPYQFPSRSPHELSRTICETEPELPSRVVAREDETLLLASFGAIQSLDMMCRAHGANVESLSSQLAGDLDNILMKALPKTLSHAIKRSMICAVTLLAISKAALSSRPFIRLHAESKQSRRATQSTSLTKTRSLCCPLVS